MRGVVRPGGEGASRHTAQQWLKELWEESRTQSQALLSPLQRGDKGK